MKCSHVCLRGLGRYRRQISRENIINSIYYVARGTGLNRKILESDTWSRRKCLFQFSLERAV